MATIDPAPIELGETESAAAARLRAAFRRVRNPMLLVDDQRRCVTANDPACALLGIESGAVPWHRIDDFTAAEDRKRLDEQWEAFLANGAIEGWYQLPLPSGGALPIEFSATADVLPGRHLSVVTPRRGSTPGADAHGEVRVVRGPMVIVRRETGWARVVARDAKTLPLTQREREVLGFVAGGLRGGEIAQHLVVSPEAIRTHVADAMTKLGAHTRAHAVAIALRMGEVEARTVNRG